MSHYRNIAIVSDERYCFTQGLEQFIKYDIRIILQKRTNDEYQKVLKYLINYILDYKPTINHDQTISYYSWLLKFKQSAQRFLDICEISVEGEDFVDGVDYSIQTVNEQEEECRKNGAVPTFPTFNQNIVISKGVYEGLDVDAVRYPSPEHMTGWWLTTEMYDNNINSLMNVHYYHVAFKRPNLIRYFALPYGYSFYSSNGEIETWYDKNVVES